MRDLHAPALSREQGELLERATYKRDFRVRSAEIRDRDSWKFERLQYFEEKDNASWNAFRRGDWVGSLRLIDGMREESLKASETDALHGSFFHRVRVVEQPLTSYMQWSLHVLRMQAECGNRIRVITKDLLADSDRVAPLPEVVILGGRTLYQVLYTDEGVPNGAVRYTDADTIKHWESYIKALYAEGEDVRAYFDREVAPLPPPLATEE